MLRQRQATHCTAKQRRRSEKDSGDTWRLTVSKTKNNTAHSAGVIGLHRLRSTTRSAVPIQCSLLLIELKKFFQLNLLKESQALEFYTSQKCGNALSTTNRLLLGFCRAMLCISSAYAVMRCLCVCLSVCLTRSCIVSKRIKISLIFFTVG